jgi:Tol biopolymer transport system component
VPPPTSTPLPTPTHTASPTPQQVVSAALLAYISLEPETPEIRLAAGDGQLLDVLFSGVDPEAGLAWAPEGARLAFAAAPRTEGRLIILDLDGKTLLDLETGYPLADLAWAPDGRLLAFTAQVDETGRQLFLLDPLSGELEQATRNFDVTEMAWAPDTSRLAFVSGHTGQPDIFSATPSGRVFRLTTSSYEDYGLSWSPDGSQILFVSHRSSNRDSFVPVGQTAGAVRSPDIFVMYANGQSQINLTANPAPDVLPVWSPDGSRIVFASFRADPAGGPQLFTSLSDGSQPELFAPLPVSISPVVWAHDGSRFALSSAHLFVIRADGTAWRQLSFDVAAPSSPAWSPDDLAIAFLEQAAGRSDLYLVPADGSVRPLRIGPAVSPGWQPAPSTFGTPVPTQVPIRDCFDAADFLADITILDGAEVKRRETFVKTWRVLNIGSCTWDERYTLRFLEGIQFQGEAVVPLDGPVAPGEIIDLSITLTAPNLPGSYQGAWALVGPRGQLLAGDYWLSVNISVPVDE